MEFVKLEQEIRQILDFFGRLYDLKDVALFSIQSESGNGIDCPAIPTVKLSSQDTKKLNEVKIIRKGRDQDEIFVTLFNKTGADLLIPIGGGNQCSGLLAIEGKSRLAESVIDSSRIIAGYVEHVIDKFVLIEDLKTYSQGMERLLSELGVIHEISHAFGAGHNLQTLLEFIMEKCMQLMNAEAASLMLLTAGEDELEFKVALGPKGKHVKPFRLPIGKGIAGWVAATREPVLIADAYADPRFDPSFDKKSGFKTRSILCVPMFYQDKTIGVMQILNRRDGQVFTDEDKMLFTIFATQAALSIENARLINEAIEKERMEKELQVASEIQQLVLPKILPDIPELDIAASNIPCKQIGGDYYDVRKIDANRYLIIIADVSGKGVPAALVVSTMQASLKANLNYTTNLVELTNYLNRLIVEQTTSDRYITFFISLFDTKENKLQYVNAGHNPPFIFRGNQIVRLEGGGIPLGFMPFEYEEQSVNLDPGDMIMLYTDGLAETMNPLEEEFGEERLIQFCQNRNGDNPSTILDNLTRKLGDFREGQVLLDDLTMIIMKKK